MQPTVVLVVLFMCILCYVCLCYGVEYYLCAVPNKMIIVILGLRAQSALQSFLIHKNLVR